MAGGPGPLSPSGWTFLVVFTALIPLLSVRGAFRVQRPGGTPTRAQHLSAVFISQGMMLFLALCAMRYDWIELFPRPALGWEDPVLALLFLASTLGTLPMRWRWKPVEERRGTLWMLPHRTRDLIWWALVAIVAGVVEEIAYRGVLFTLWQRVLGSWWAAVALCVAAFSLAHFVQGWRAMAAIVLISVGSHGIVGATGDLYAVIAVHIVYDFLAGVILLRLARREGLRAP